MLSYVLITAARNEERYIENAVLSVARQSVLPVKWMIIDDGSVDRTAKIISSYLDRCPWIELAQNSKRGGRDFASKARCFNEGFRKLSSLDFDVVGNLDADITFEPEYLAFLLDKFEADPQLGVAGTPFTEDGKHYDYRFTSIEHVSGACQLFRRRCFEDIGGYTPLEGGGIDWLAVTSARMKGWTTRTFLEKTCVHHRKIGTGDRGRLAAWFMYGQKNYRLGGHPVWHVIRSVYQMRNRPYLVGGLFLLAGYLWASATRMKRPISPELLEFSRREQMAKLKHIIRRGIGGKRAVSPQ